MKKYYVAFVIFLSLAVISCSLFGPEFGTLSDKGLEIYFSFNTAGSKTLNSDKQPALKALQSRSETIRTIPASGSIGFTKIWFPTPGTFDTLVRDNNQENGLESGLINLTSDISGLEFYKALDRDVNNPYTLSSGDGVPLVPNVPFGYNQEFNGIVVETVFIQVDMEEGNNPDDYFKIRWYHQDSAQYKAGDVLIQLEGESDWQFLFVKREITFDYIYVGHENPINTYERIQNVSLAYSVFRTTERNPSDTYYENGKWDRTDLQSDYVETFLKNVLPGTLTTYEKNKLNVEDITLVQLFNIGGDVPNDRNVDLAPGEKPTTMPHDSPGFTDKPALIVGYGVQADIDNPYTIETFPEDANEAELYKIELGYEIGNKGDSNNGFGIGLPYGAKDGSDVPDAKWTEIENLDQMVILGCTTGGVEVKFGWKDFNGVWQGEFAANAGT